MIVSIKITLSIILSLLLHNSNTDISKDTTLVYENNKVIGKIAQKTTFTCKMCYAINSIKIGNKEIKLQIPVSNRGVNNESILEYDFAIDKIENNLNSTEIRYSSTLSSKAYEVKLDKNEKGEIYISRVITHSYGIKDIKIGENDYESFQSNSVCQNEKKTFIKDTITVDDNFFFTNEECFDCPIEYTIEECIANKKKGVKMNWE